MSEVWIPSCPEQRQYTCPGCNKGVQATRLGDTCTYIIKHLEEKKGEEGEGKCKYKGAIPIKLLGYVPPKKEAT